MNPFDLTRELSFEEVKQFFSQNEEFIITPYKDNMPETMVITYKWLHAIEYVDGHEIKTYDSFLQTIHNPTIQTLIDAIKSLSYMKGWRARAKQKLKS